jgi:hypothetical protein
MTSDIDSMHNLTLDRLTIEPPQTIPSATLRLTSRQPLQTQACSLGWWAENHPRWGVTQKMRTVSARAIK